MAQTNLNVRIDENLKKQFDAFCDELGLSMSMAINIFVKKVIREQRIPFELGVEVPNKATLKAIDDVEKGIGLSKVYEDVDELFEDLNA